MAERTKTRGDVLNSRRARTKKQEDLTHVTLLLEEAKRIMKVYEKPGDCRFNPYVFSTVQHISHANNNVRSDLKAILLDDYLSDKR